MPSGCSNALRLRAQRIESAVKQYYEVEKRPEKEIQALLRTEHNFPCTLSTVKKLDSEFCVRNRNNRARSTTVKTPLISSDGGKKSYRRSGYVGPRKRTLNESTKDVHVFRLEPPLSDDYVVTASTESEKPDKDDVDVDVDNYLVEELPNDNTVCGSDDLTWLEEILRNLEHPASSLCSDPFLVESERDVAFGKLISGLATVVISEDTLSIKRPALCWKLYSSNYNAFTVAKCTNVKQGMKRLAQLTDDMGELLTEKSTHLMVAIIRTAMLRWDDRLQPVLESYIKTLKARATVIASGGRESPALLLLEALSVLMKAPLTTRCHLIGTVVEKLSTLPEANFLAVHEIWELYVKLLAESKAYHEAERQSRNLLSYIEVASGQHSVHTYRARRLHADIIFQAGDPDLAKAMHLSIRRSAEFHNRRPTHNGCPREWDSSEYIYRICLQQGLIEEAATWLSKAVAFSFANYSFGSGNHDRLLAERTAFISKYG